MSTTMQPSSTTTVCDAPPSTTTPVTVKLEEDVHNNDSSTPSDDKHSSKELQPAMGFFRDLHDDQFVATFGVGELGTGFAGHKSTTPHLAVGESSGIATAAANALNNMPIVPLALLQSYLTSRPQSTKSTYITYTGELFPMAATATPADKVEHKTLSFLQGPEPVILTTPVASTSSSEAFPMSVINDNEDSNATLKKQIAQKRKTNPNSKIRLISERSLIATSQQSLTTIAPPQPDATNDATIKTAPRPRQRKQKSPTEIAVRKQKRRCNHNAVERRRRDNINDRIAEIETLLVGEHYEFGHIDERSGKASTSGPSKGETLHKATMHLRFLNHKEQLMKQAMVAQHEMLTRMSQQCHSLKGKLIEQNGKDASVTSDFDVETVPDIYATLKALDDASKGMAEMDAVTKMSVMADAGTGFDYDEQGQLEDVLERQQFELAQPEVPVELTPSVKI